MQDRKALKVEVAQCCRMMEQMGLVDFSGHVSARLPEGGLLINSWGASRFAVTPDDVVEADALGNSLSSVKVPSEITIHCAIYRARPDVQAIAHIHPRSTIALSVSGRPFVPVIYHGSIFKAGVPVYDDCRHVNSSERGDLLARALGPNARAVIMRGHGAVVATQNVRSCFFASVYLEDNADMLLHAYQAGGNIIPLRQDELDDGNKGIWVDGQFSKVWTYYSSKTGVDFSSWA